MHVRGLMTLHYIGYFGSMLILLILLLLLSIKISEPLELIFKILLAVSGLLFGVIGLKIAYIR